MSSAVLRMRVVMGEPKQARLTQAGCYADAGQAKQLGQRAEQLRASAADLEAGHAAASEVQPCLFWSLEARGLSRAECDCF